MASLLDLTVQGDVATITDESQLPKIKLMEAARALPAVGAPELGVAPDRPRAGPDRLGGLGRPTSATRCSGGCRRSSSARSGSPTSSRGLVMAAEDKHEEAFLLTQQVDEARHAQHFNRLFEEVFRYDGCFRGSAADRALRDLNEDYFTLFDGHLIDAHQALLVGPVKRRGQGRLHHGLPHGDRGHARAHRPALPDRAKSSAAGSSPGTWKRSRRSPSDEHRHVAYGTWFLQQKSRDPRARAARAGQARSDVAVSGRRARPTGDTASATSTSTSALQPAR